MFPIYRQPPLADFTNKTIHGDCLEVLKLLPKESVDLILTDPPYLANYQSRDHRTLRNDRNDSWLQPAYSAMFRVLKNKYFCISFYGWTKTDRFFRAWTAAGFRPVGHIVWVKHYASSTCFLRYHHEQAYLLAKGNPSKPQVMLKDVLDWKYTGNVLHLTQKKVYVRTINEDPSGGPSRPGGPYMGQRERTPDRT